MITKVGYDIVDKALQSPALLGAVGGLVLGKWRAGNLSEDQQDALRAEHDINSGPFGLRVRNAVRGALGAMVGAGSGAGLGGAASALADISQGGSGVINPRAALIGGLLGAALGAYKATNKYSKGSADDILARTEKLKNRQEERRQLSSPGITLNMADLGNLLGVRYGNGVHMAG